MTRRDNGDGSVYRQRPGLWAAYISSPDGRRKYFYAKTKQAVIEKLRSSRIKVAQGVPLEDDKQTVGMYLNDWIVNE